ncbi:MAG TPA: Cache 3/Cache 2 fusion domain-containing protein [Methyloceanibacter sp.]|nr:Cache 3/Cache 2 fusion domain-containing protein [Methyloceanibacter sp.]
MEPIFAKLIAASATGRLLAKKARVGLLMLAVGFPATVMLMPGAGNAQDARIAKSMAALKDQTAKLGAPKIDGTDPVGGKDAPALYFGSTKMNNNFTVVDEVAKEDGQGMAATLFVKGGDEYIRAATNVPKPDGSGRAIGTILAGPALESIKMGKAYYGKAPILGTPYVTGYEPIKDASGAIIGIYFVGYSQDDLQAKVEGRLAYAKTLLGITDSQAAAWKAYEDVSRTNVQSIRAARQAMMTAEQSGSTIDRMHAQTDMAQARLDAMKALQPATEGLYNALTPDQRERADVVLLLLGSSGGVEF